MKINNKTVISLIAVILISVLTYVLWTQLRAVPIGMNEDDDGAMCSMDAKECPDGSWVGRSGPNCQFVCPIPVSTSTKAGSVTVEAKLQSTVTPIAEKITILSVVEDSRCPIGAQCIQAGIVTIKIQIESASGVAVHNISVGDTITTETESISLVTVRPEREVSRSIGKEDYRFIFSVVKR